MKYFDKLKEMYQTHILNIDAQIKKRFEFYLNKCKDASEKKTDKKEELDSESESDKE